MPFPKTERKIPSPKPKPQVTNHKAQTTNPKPQSKSKKQKHWDFLIKLQGSVHLKAKWTPKGSVAISDKVSL
jgi:hypothetical protein